jgi:hypothetical protein
LVLALFWCSLKTGAYKAVLRVHHCVAEEVSKVVNQGVQRIQMLH